MSEEIIEVKHGDKYEMKCGITLSILAAAMALNSVGGARWGTEEIKGSNEKGTAYAWYQSKSIKAAVVEAQRDTLATQLKAGNVQGVYRVALEEELSSLNKSLARYEKEKREILMGSDGVGQANWAIADKSGTLGLVKGAQDWERYVKKAEDAGDLFDLSNMALELSLVLGSISLILSLPKIRNAFYWGMVGLGLVGIYFMTQAFLLVGW